MRIEFAKSLKSISASHWNKLWSSDYPFTRYEFLTALEYSDSATSITGWTPQHCLIFEDEQLLAAMPLYSKTHSYGEYVFDWSWANAFHENGYNYYPKLLNAIPFTPTTGPRWAFAPHLNAAQQQTLLGVLLEAVARHVREHSYSSFHSLFANAAQRAQALRCMNATEATDRPSLTLRSRIDCQFHWFNQGFTSFADFLDTFNARKRKNLKKERRKIVEQSIHVSMLEGHLLTTEDWQQFYRLYQRTYLKRSGHTGYLNEGFFQLLGRDLPHNIVMAKAVRDGEWIAAALYMRDDKTLYGRYWGATEEFDGLHFECCYYQGIEYAIAKGIQRFDPGAQGEHKIARGFTPVFTASLHHIEHPAFDRAISDFLQQEQRHIVKYCQQARSELPFKDGAVLIDEHCLIEDDALNAPLD